ncbi:hypothetical protein ACHHYP_15661 [Achlya hypogyna]|uniref:Transmembrane protein n=1 Tax=Achlya hypogyna TaxID=1202772 RepID=A0A1V9YAG5_ACHHY|nr:hypothetical protein ACHHYP_15661 [Achlya hypogyna]
MLRTLLRSPRLSADWTGNYEAKAVVWAEFALDGAMAAASYVVAHSLDRVATGMDLMVPLVLFGLFLSTWQLHTHFHARFVETSFLHYLLLYGVLAGVCSMVLSPIVGPAFGHGLLLTRISILAMYTNVFIVLPETRSRLAIDLVLLSTSISLVLVSLVVDDSAALACYAGALGIETVVQFLWAIKRWCLPPPSTAVVVPVSIDYIAERHGYYVVAVLSQSSLGVLFESATLAPPIRQFHMSVHLSVLLLFTMAMFYFAIQPPRELHAMRRSAVHGVFFVAIHYLLLPTLLVLGVATKRAMNAAVIDSQPLPPAAVWLLFGAISGAMVAMLLLRLAHYGGRGPLDTDSPSVRRIKAYWWVPIGVSTLLPLGVALLLNVSRGADPITALAAAAALLLLWVFAETSVMHWIVAGPLRVGESNETDPLLEGQLPRTRGRTCSFFSEDD